MQLQRRLFLDSAKQIEKCCQHLKSHGWPYLPLSKCPDHNCFMGNQVQDTHCSAKAV